MPTDLEHRSPTDPRLHERLHRWVAASLITPDEADAIEAFEAAATAGRPAAGATFRGPVAERRIPLVTEALAYVGAALAAGAAGVLLGDRWEELTPAVRVACVGVAGAAAFVGGLLLRPSDEPAIRRLTGVLWLASAGLAAFLAWLVAHDVLELGGSAPTLVTGVVTTVAGGGLYAARRAGAQQVAPFLGLLLVAGASAPEGVPAMLAVWSVAVAWTVAGIVGLLDPGRVALLLGGVVALWAPAALGAEGDLGMWLWLATAVCLLVASIVTRETLLLGVGAIGLFGSTVRVLVELFGGTAAMPAALLVTGAVVLAAAIWYARRSSGPRAATRSARRSPS